jgi:hypothetical protein
MARFIGEYLRPGKRRKKAPSHSMEFPIREAGHCPSRKHFFSRPDDHRVDESRPDRRMSWRGFFDKLK